MTPESLVLARRPSRDAGLLGPGFTGCIAQLQLDGVPRGIRQAHSVTGQLSRCEDRTHVQKSVRESECGMSYLSLSSPTLLKPSLSETLLFSAIISSPDQKVMVLSAGQLKVSARKGKIVATCSHLKISITFRHVYVVHEPFRIAMEVFNNYVSLTISRSGQEPRNRKLPCYLDLDRNDFIVGSDSPSVEGCIKKL